VCLAVPGKVLSVTGDDPILRTGRVDFGGVVKEIQLAYVPEVAPGDYVLVHVGFAITILDEAEAGRVFRALDALGALADEAAGAP
jgi:hydrogenase expression/formation protein HypC